MGSIKERHRSTDAKIGSKICLRRRLSIFFSFSMIFGGKRALNILFFISSTLSGN